MSNARPPSPDSIASVVTVSAVIVAASTPLNFALMLLCPGTSTDTVGPLFLRGFINVGLFLVVCGVVDAAMHRCTVSRRRLAIGVVLALYLAFWLGLSLLIVVYAWIMVATGNA